MGHRPQLENLLCKVNEAAPEKPQVLPDRRVWGQEWEAALLREVIPGVEV